MATVTDTATGGVYEGVSGSLLEYYRGEGARFEIVEDDADPSATFPQVWENGERVDVAPEGADSTAVGEQSEGDGTGGADGSSPFVLPEGQYLASDQVVYDRATGQAAVPQPTPEQIAQLAPPSV